MCEGAGHDASIGRALPHDEVELLRFFRSGHRDGRVWSWVDYVDNGLVIENRTGYEQGCGFFFLRVGHVIILLMERWYSWVLL